MGNRFSLNTHTIILESELVSGFMTEHAAVIFVFFFLAEYSSILLICMLSGIFFLGGYLFDFTPIIYWTIYLIQFVNFDSWLSLKDYDFNSFLLYNSLLEGLIYSCVLAFKSCALVFAFIWSRASLPRVRFDQLMLFCWTILLPIVIAFVILVPCILYCLVFIPNNIILHAIFFIRKPLSKLLPGGRADIKV